MRHKDKPSTKKKKYEDEFEEKADALIKTLKPGHYAENATILQKAGNFIKKSANPEAQTMHTFMESMKNIEKAKAEEDDYKAVRLYDKALALLETLDSTDKPDKDLLETRIKRYDRLLKINRGDHSNCSELFFKMAECQKPLGKSKDHHSFLALHFLENALVTLSTDPVKGLKILDKCAKEFQKVKLDTAVHKVKAMRLMLLSRFQPTPHHSLKYLKLQLQELEQTNDKFGLNECKGSIHFLTGMIEKDWRKKAKEFELAAKFYKKDKLDSYYHNSQGLALHWKIHDKSLTLEQICKIQKRAANHFKLSRNRPQFHGAMGHFYTLKAVKLGVLKKNEKQYIKNLTKANYHYARSGHPKRTNFTAGIAIFSIATKLPSNKAKGAFKKAGEILGTIGEPLGDLAYYEYYKILLNSEYEKRGKVASYKGKALEHLGKWLRSSEREPKKTYEIPLPFHVNEIDLFFKVEYYKLRGELEKDVSTKRHYFEQSIKYCDEIIEKYSLKEKAWRSKGWVYMNLFDFPEALQSFEEAYKLRPEKVVKNDIDFALKMLKKGYRDSTMALKQEVRFSRELQRTIARFVSDSQKSPIEISVNCPGQTFFQKALSALQKAGKAIEEFYPRHKDRDEEALRDEMIQCLKMTFPDVAAESKKAKGKRDINIKDPVSGSELTSECLIWGGPIYYYSKKDQLFDRYLTWHNKEVALITFVRNANFKNICIKARNAIKGIPDTVANSFQDLSGDMVKLYVTEHNHKSGVNVRLYHLLFHLPRT